MPDYTRGRRRDQLRFVALNTVFHYGWRTIDLAARTGLSVADLTTQLGHLTATEAAAVANSIMVTGANSPKPARVTLRDPTAPVSQPGSTNTFIAYDKAAAATAAGWVLSDRARGVKLTANVAGVRSVTAIAELSNGALYAFPLNKADFDRVAGDLGLAAAATITTATERNRLVTGSKTKPGEVSKDEGGGVFSTFVATASIDSAVAAGYNKERDEFIEYAAGAAAP